MISINVFIYLLKVKHSKIWQSSKIFILLHLSKFLFLLPLLRTTTQTQDEVKGRLLLNVVVTERTAVLKLLASEDQALLVRGDTAHTHPLAKH